MRWLPCLPAPLDDVALPLPDATAECLIDGLLTSDAATRSDQFAKAVQFDPALAVWTVLRNGASIAAASCPTLSQMTSALADLLPAALLPVGAANAEPEWFGRVESGHLAGIARRWVTTAKRASRLAAEDQQADPERAYVLALLCSAPDWLKQCAATSIADHSASWPNWWQACMSGRVDQCPAPESTHVLCAAREIQNGSADAEAQSDRAVRWWTDTSPAGTRLEELARRLTRLEQLENQFEARLQEEKLEAMHTLAAGAGHEINNPLGSIAGRAQLLLRDEKDPERRRTLAKINSQAFRAHEMIADMMLFARPPAPVREPVDLVPVIDDVIDELQETADERQTQVVREVSGEAITVNADRSQLMVALRAMCTNALEALGSGGRIELSAALVEGNTNGPEVEIVVRDDGPGISVEKRPHLFDPFYSGREAGRGLGFGLSKCWRIVTGHGGRIDVRNSPGRGATFVIILPAA